MPDPTRRIIFTSDARFSVTDPAPGVMPTLTGYAIVWNTLSSDRGGYVVRLKPGSATFATPTHALQGHDFNLLLGATDNGTLRLASDDIGVRFELDLPNTSTGRDVAELVRRRDIKGMSFAMSTLPKGTTTNEGGQSVFNAESYEVDEISVTPIASFSTTTVEIKPDPPAPVSDFSKRIDQSLQLASLSLAVLKLPENPSTRSV